jgi:hypothetical protein
MPAFRTSRTTGRRYPLSPSSGKTRVLVDKQSDEPPEEPDEGEYGWRYRDIEELKPSVVREKLMDYLDDEYERFGVGDREQLVELRVAIDDDLIIFDALAILERGGSVPEVIRVLRGGPLEFLEAFCSEGTSDDDFVPRS